SPQRPRASSRRAFSAFRWPTRPPRTPPSRRERRWGKWYWCRDSALHALLVERRRPAHLANRPPLGPSERARKEGGVHQKRARRPRGRRGGRSRRGGPASQFVPLALAAAFAKSPAFTMTSFAGSMWRRSAAWICSG